ncbi:DNA polymerase III subunit beta [Paenibacillus agricola]|uniref:Beta sliding clamp n=1 Tax=Paenibacillus agricola TaxID=2716264 RepID=A0ABX0JF54_9BACL|nr:DNA polymerase III subunit beta [Paenibacillus agricola]NHN33328.1 DNA polymerase III subunit beta [Paenibacillus agricola]
METTVKAKVIKFTVKDVKRFTDKVTSIAEACSTTTTIPILSCMKIDVKAGNVVFTGGDGVITTCIGERDLFSTEHDASFAVPAKLFAEIIRKLPAGEMKLTMKTENLLLIEAGTAKFDLAILDAKEYPSITFDQEITSTFTIPAQTLVASFRSTMYAAATKVENLIGVNMQIEAGETDLKLTATDRNRLSRSLIENVISIPFKETLSIASCKEIVRIFDGFEATLKMEVSKSAISISGPGIKLITKVLDQPFPDTDKLIPRVFEIETTLDKDKLEGALNRAAVFAKDKKMAIFTLDNDQITIVSKAEVGQVMDVLEDCKTEGKELRIALDVFYLLAALNVISQKRVRLSFTSPVTPMIIRPADDAIKTLGVLIPMRIRE